MKKNRIIVLAAALLASSMLLAGCGGGGASSTAQTQGSTESGNKHSIAFFGFAKANTFAQATFSGIEQYAKENGATATFLDGNFDAQTQVKQIQDATVSDKYDIFIVQANDGTAVIPAVTAAIAKGKTVVAEFTPIGTKYDTIEPQIKGLYNVGNSITGSGTALANLAKEACKGVDGCQVAYLQGNKALPLDNARTKAFEAGLKDTGITLYDNYEGGYTRDTGRAAGQDVFQSHPDVDVLVASSQALLGAQDVVPAGSKVKLVGFGASKQATDALKSGKWDGLYYIPEAKAGAKAAEIGIKAADGEKPETAVDTTKLPGATTDGHKDNFGDENGTFDE